MITTLSYSVKCLLLNITELTIDLFVEFLNLLGVHVPIVLVQNDALCVVLVLNLHAGEAAHVHIVAEVLPGRESLRNIHVQIEGLVGLVLAILDAAPLLSGLSGR